MSNRCPDCGFWMKIRYRRSDNDPFLGCSRFPRCKGTRKLSMSGFIRRVTNHGHLSEDPCSYRVTLVERVIHGQLVPVERLDRIASPVVTNHARRHNASVVAP